MKIGARKRSLRIEPVRTMNPLLQKKSWRLEGWKRKKIEEERLCLAEEVSMCHDASRHRHNYCLDLLSDTAG